MEHRNECDEQDSVLSLTCHAICSHTKVRGFHDLGIDLVEEVVSTIERHLPSQVLGWGFDDDDGSWWFKYANVTLQLHPSCHVPGFFESVITTYTTVKNSAMERMIRDETCALVEKNGPNMKSFREVSVLVLQITEMVALGSMYIKYEELGWYRDYNPFENYEDDAHDSHASSSAMVESDESEAKWDIFNLKVSDVMSMIPNEYTVLSIESIRRGEFTRFWLEYQDELRQRAFAEKIGPLRNKLHPHTSFQPPSRLKDSKSELVEHVVRPLITFHGSSRANVASIIEYGFLMPGTLLNGQMIRNPRSNVLVRRGMYSSQSADYALSYSRCHGTTPTTRKELPGLLLLVVATLMGRTYRGPHVHGELQPHHDAHFDGGYEYIAYDSRAMLPCFVVRLDLTETDAVKRIERVQLNPRLASFYPLQNYKTPGDIQREQIAKKMAALKWFPYGYGPATGVQFKVEGIAPTDDDEEPHGYEYRDWLVRYHGENYGRVLSWMDVIEQDQGLLVEMFRQPD